MEAEAREEIARAEAQEHEILNEINGESKAEGDTTEEKGEEEGVNANDSGDGRIVDSYNEALEILQTCSLIVGMHPDQAAEPIVDFAMANNKPFAVVPCCVYSSCFPKRVNENG